MRFLVCFWTNPLDREPLKALGFLRTVIYTDILRRLFLCSGTPSEWVVLLLDKDEDEMGGVGKWEAFCCEYRLLSAPSRVVRSAEDLPNDPSQVVIFSPELLQVLTVVCQTDADHPIKKLMSANTVTLRPLEIVGKEGKAHQTFPAGIGPKELRMLVTLAHSVETTVGSSELQYAVRLGRDISMALGESKLLPLSVDRPDDLPSVMRGGFHNAVSDLSNMDFIEIGAGAADHAFRALEIYGRYLSLLEDKSGRDEFKIFREAVRFCFFPQTLDTKRNEGIHWPRVDPNLVAHWEREHRVTLPVQVDGKVRARIVVKAWEMEDLDRIVPMVLAMPSVRKWLKEEEPAGIHFKKGKMLSFQSAEAKRERDGNSRHKERI